ncbi:MAG: hypothetical protein CTY36_02705 [Methylocystis sp.]|nr:MAG: hypothetical protein CTY36_02705 [Methylocystis sp.]
MLVSGDRAATYGYAEVESALAKVFIGRSQNIAPLRGRLKTFQRAGLTPESPGRGRVIRYTVSDIYDWALALALADFGLPPEAIINFVKEGYFWNDYVPMISKLKSDSLFFCVLPFVLGEQPTLQFQFVVMKGSKISAKSIAELGGRVAFIDLTKLKNGVDKALDAGKFRGG